MGTLYYGDNLDIIKRYNKDETVDLMHSTKRPTTWLYLMRPNPYQRMSPTAPNDCMREPGDHVLFPC